MQLNFNSLVSLIKELPDENSCREYFEQVRWGGIPVCPHCADSSIKHYKLKVKGVFKGMYKCVNCKERFTVTKGTLLEGSHISFQKWIIAFYIFSSHKKGISSHQLAKDLGITQKSAWFMLHRLRAAFSLDDNEKMGGGGQAVEVDESYVGGKVKGMSKSKRQAVKEKKLDQNANKTVLMGYAVRGGDLKLEVVKDKGGVKQALINSVDQESVIITDGSNLYANVYQNFIGHEVVDHAYDEFVRGTIHTNTIEGVFSMFDRMVIGIYHYISPKHMQSYANELSFRYNSRKSSERSRLDLALRQTNGSRLTYKGLIGK